MKPPTLDDLRRLLRALEDENRHWASRNFTPGDMQPARRAFDIAAGHYVRHLLRDAKDDAGLRGLGRG